MRFSDLPLYDEIKGEYERLRRSGMHRTSAVGALKEKYVAELSLGAEDDGKLFWVALADAQYNLKELELDVSKLACDALDTISHNEWKISQVEILRRHEHYSKAPMPESQLQKSPRFSCGWLVGDTFAYELSGQDAKSAGILGWHMLFRKIGEVDFGDEQRYPMVTVTAWGVNSLPQNSEEFQQKQILLLNRFKLQNMDGYVDDYRAVIVLENKRQLNKLNLVYLGNFPNVPYPPTRIIGNIRTYAVISPKYIDMDCVNFVLQSNYFMTK